MRRVSRSDRRNGAASPARWAERAAVARPFPYPATSAPRYAARRRGCQGEQGMERAVPGVEGLGAFIDLQRDADRAPGQQRRKVGPRHGVELLAGLKVHSSAAATVPAQVEVDEVGGGGKTRCPAVRPAIGDRKVRRRQSQQPRAAGRNGRLAHFVGHAEHGVGQRAAQRLEVGHGSEVAGVQNHQVGHGACPLTVAPRLASPGLTRPSAAARPRRSAASPGRWR